jgi:hypothetical protein
MNSSDGYRQDLFLAFLFRVGLFCGMLAVIAIILLGCSRSGPEDVLPSTSAARPLFLGPGEASQTRSQLPYNKECDEKSDSSLRKPLE